MNPEIIKLNNKLTKIFASYDQGVPDAIKNVDESDIKALNDRIDFLHQRLSDHRSDVWNWQDEHNKGHLPKLKSKEQMKKAIKALGLEDEYEVIPSTIYASNGSIKEYVIKFIKKKL